jgi:hypothetical protein
MKFMIVHHNALEFGNNVVGHLPLRHLKKHVNKGKLYITCDTCLTICHVKFKAFPDELHKIYLIMLIYMTLPTYDDNVLTKIHIYVVPTPGRFSQRQQSKAAPRLD